MNKAYQYNVTIRYNNQTKLYEARVQELPDVCEFATTVLEVYALAIDTIRTSMEMFEDGGWHFPEPIQ